MLFRKNKLDSLLTAREFLLAVRMSFMQLKALSHSLVDTAIVLVALRRGNRAFGLLGALSSLIFSKSLDALSGLLSLCHINEEPLHHHAVCSYLPLTSCLVEEPSCLLLVCILSECFVD